MAKNVEDLHSDSNNINKQTALTEKGEIVSGRGDAVNMHDILTGSDPQGLYSTAGGDTTCGNWTKSGDGSAIMAITTVPASKKRGTSTPGTPRMARAAAARITLRVLEAPV